MSFDPDAKIVLDMIKAAGRPPFEQLTPDEARQAYMNSRKLLQPVPEDVAESRDTVAPGPHGDIPVRLYRPAGTAASDVLPALIYYHGGGWLLGGLDSHDVVCRRFANAARCRVVSVDYRMAPEHKFPAAVDDCEAATRWAVGNAATLGIDASKVAVGGDSAGGNLAAAVAHATRGHARAAIGQVLIYPGLGGRLGQGSYLTHADAPLLSVRDMDYYRDMRAGGRDVSGDATFAPFNDKDYSGLPATVVITAECDPLSDDGRDYRDRIKSAGGRAAWINEPGLVHGYLRARHSVGRARSSFTRIVEAIRSLGKGEWDHQP